jgi:enhancing lycopene biosynthesis protein 2
VKGCMVLDGEEMKEKVVVLRELDRAIIYNE